MLPRRCAAWLLSAGLLLAAVPAALGQHYYQSPEPPLADESGAPIQQAGAREPGLLAANVRLSESPAPVVSVHVRAPAALPVDQNVELRIVVENSSRVPARNVVVSYAGKGANYVKSVPQQTAASADTFSWQFPALAAGERKEIVLTVKPPPGATELESKARVTFEHEHSARTRFAKPELKLTKIGPESALCQDILIFILEVTNPGPVELTDVKLTDTLPDGLKHRPDEEKDRPFSQGPLKLINLVTPDGRTRTWTIPRLGPGQTRRVEYYVAAEARPAGLVEHTGQAEAAGGVKAAAQGKVTLAELALELNAEAPPRRAAAVPARVLITLTNRSPRPLRNILVTDQMLDDCKLEAVSAGGQQFSNKVQWIVPAIAPNETRQLDLVVRRPEGGQVRHKVSAVYRGLTREKTTATEFDAAAALSWDFRGEPATVEVNGVVTYTLTVRNTGAAPATNVRPVVTLPPSLDVDKAEPAHRVQGKQITFEPVTLPANARATFLVRAKAVQPHLQATVQAELYADLFPSGAVRRDAVTAIGGSDPAAPPPPTPTAPARVPTPVPPPRP